MTNATAAPSSTASTFRLTATHPIPSLNLELQQFVHEETGARHIHLASSDDQNCFMVAFQTLPEDSTGVAHILEHTTLCGSERFPVRDPFFMMTRRSLNTFMNAFTSSDWTAYPFASRNRKDFDNLLQVYLDATFFPLLNPLDFAQEGHRLEFVDNDPDSNLLQFKGIVFNEMKGAMSSPVNALWQSLSRAIYPTTTYHHNSGGDPVEIPDLSYEDLLAFHRRHYHPSNAIFMTYGDIAPAELQQQFQEQVLCRFQRQDLNIGVGNEVRFTTPQQVTDYYALDGEEKSSHKTHIVLAWLLGESCDAEAAMEANLLSGVLLDNGASPLREALERSSLGQAPSPLCGLQDSSKEMLFACGLEGSDTEHAEAVEQLIIDTLRKIATEGVPTTMVEAVLHQLELAQREVSGDSYPYGLQLMVHTLGATLHGADPLTLLDIDPVIDHLRQKIADPAYIPRLVEQLLLDNTHRLRLVMAPDSELTTRRQQAEQERLAAAAAGLTPTARAEIIAASTALNQRQAISEDPELLPRVGIEDVPLELAIPEGEQIVQGDLSVTCFDRATNGLIYEKVVIALPQFTPEQQQLLPLFSDIVTEVGCGGRNYLETQALQSEVSGGISASISLRAAVDDLQSYSGFFSYGGKALARNRSPLTQLIHETFSSARFDERDRIRELVAQERMGQEQRITGSGHLLAMAAAASGFTPTAANNHRWNGLSAIQWFKDLDDRLTHPEELEQLQQQLSAIAEQLQQAPLQLLLISQAEERASLLESTTAIWQQPSSVNAASPFTLPPASGRVHHAWTTSTQVNFCARAYPTVPSADDDAPPLIVLGGFLRNNFLHRTIREQGGAYGGGAGYDGESGAFRFYSYRDPRLDETLLDFDNAIHWLLENQHPQRLLEEAILGVIASIDKPGSPAGEAASTFFATLHGRTPEQRRLFRQKVLGVTMEDLLRVTERYLQPQHANTAVVTSPSLLAESRLELEPIAI
ncbi:MAG: insulinase family protein [Gammaproteobacteria bacterium]|nr:insulinase family protein [Gammaproteobacteria bacterium]